MSTENSDSEPSVERGAAASAQSTGRRRPAAGSDPLKRRQILDGARRVFINMGFDAASMNDITREAGVSKGTIYVYFQNKEDLFDALMAEERQSGFANLYEGLERDGDLREILIAFGVTLVKRITSPTVLGAQRVVIGVCERMPELGVRFYERGPKEGHDKLRVFLAHAVEKKKLSIPDLSVAAYQYTDLCVSRLFRECLFGYRRALPDDEEIKEIVTAGVALFLKGYAPETS